MDFGHTMRRDMNLIRLLLLDIEGVDAVPGLDAYPEDARDYHRVLLLDAGLAGGRHGPMTADGRFHPRIDRLTWKGHEFLDACRKDAVWRRVSARIAEAGVSVSFEVLQRLLTDTVLRMVGP